MATVDKERDDANIPQNKEAQKREILRRVADELSATAKGLEPWQSILDNYRRIQYGSKPKEE